MLLRNPFAAVEEVPPPSGPASPAARAAAAALDALIGDVDWTAPVPGAVASRFAAPSGELAMVSLGDPSAPRVVLAPGVTGSKEDFALMLPVLAAAGYHVQAFDLAGQYESWQAGPQEGERFDYDLFCDDLVAVLEAGGPAHVLGYSFAGIVAQLVVARRPELVRSLALLGVPPTPGNGFRTMKVLGRVSPLASDEVGAALMLWGIMTNQNHVSPRRLEFVRSRFDLTRRESVTDIVGLMKRIPDVRAELRASPIPKLVAAGSHDLWPAERQREAAAEIGAECAIYETGHSPCETTPNELCADLLALWARVDDPQASEAPAAG